MTGPESAGRHLGWRDDERLTALSRRVAASVTGDTIELPVVPIAPAAVDLRSSARHPRPWNGLTGPKMPYAPESGESNVGFTLRTQASCARTSAETAAGPDFSLFVHGPVPERRYRQKDGEHPGSRILLLRSASQNRLPRTRLSH
jgi:hypothetical protein